MPAYDEDEVEFVTTATKEEIEQAIEEVRKSRGKGKGNGKGSGKGGNNSQQTRARAVRSCRTTRSC